MSNIVRHEEQLPIREAAAAFLKSGMFPDVKSEATAIVKILAGEEYGIGRFQAMSDIDIIKGKAVPNSQLQACLIKSSGKYNFKVVEHTESSCIIDFYELWSDKWEMIGQSSFSLKDAQKAGITNNPTWSKYPKNMLFARALSNGAKWYCADAIKGAAYNESEIEEIEYQAVEQVDNSGIDALKAGSLKKAVEEVKKEEVIETTATVEEEPEEEVKATTINNLVDTYIEMINEAPDEEILKGFGENIATNPEFTPKMKAVLKEKYKNKLKEIRNGRV